MAAEQHWDAHPQAMDGVPLPPRTLSQRPSRALKARRGASGLAYIRDESHMEVGCRNVSHPGCVPAAIKERHSWSSPDLGGPSLELHRGWPVPVPSNPFAEPSSRILPSWRYVSKFSFDNDKSAAMSRLDKFESYAPSSIHTSVSSPPSSSSPMFSEPTTITTQSHEMANRPHRISSDVFTPQQLLSPSVHSTITATLSSPGRRPGISSLPDERRPNHRRMSTGYPISPSARNQRFMSMPMALPSSSKTRQPEHPDAHASPSHSGLDRWFPGLMYAFEPPHGSHDTPTTDFNGDTIGLDEDFYALEESSSSGEVASPPLRSLQLVSKYFGGESEFSTVEEHSSSASFVGRPRRISAGELHGLHIVIPEDAEIDAGDSNSHQVPGLRPLHLAEMHRLDTHVASRHSLPAHGGHALESRHYDDESDVSSLRQSHTTRSRLPFAALHPPQEKPKADPDALQLFWFGFIGMPWLWLLGGWCLNDHSALLSPWSPPSFASYRAGLHPYGPPFSLSLHARNRLLQRISSHTVSPLTKDPLVFGDDHRGMQFLAQHPPDSVPLSQLQQWQHIERFVLINRIAVALSSFTFFACWTSGVWTIMSHF